MNKRKVLSAKFCLGAVIYAVVFLLIAGAGLFVWWDFIDVYEQSRPRTAVNAFMEQLTPETVCQGSEALLSRLDTNVQSREESCTVITQALSEGFRFAKKTGQSSDSRQVYALLSGKQEIGSFSITAGEPGKYGFRIWSLEKAEYDISFLISKPVDITVPETYCVHVQGRTLDDSYITQRDIPYTALEDFYEKYDLPTLVTYTVDSCLGEITLEARDPSGNPAVISADMDTAQLLPTCTEADQQEIEAFIPVFLERYVNFSGNAVNSIEVNYKRLKEMVASDSELVDFFYSALRGLRFAASSKDTIQEIVINQTVPLEDDRYYCDVTFRVETIGRSREVVHTENNMKLILVREEDGLKADAFTRY